MKTILLFLCLSFYSINSLAQLQVSEVPRKKLTTMRWLQATQEVTQQYAALAKANLEPAFSKAGIGYPGKQIALLAFKQERTLELWAQGDKHTWHFIKRYPFTAFSGKLGPKTRYHDDQIPEGIYKIEALNPFSAFHLSLKINYPNAFDKAQAKREHRTNLGGDIFIHGRALSVGCIAIGDKAVSELFVLISKLGKRKAKVIIAPLDFRKQQTLNLDKQPRWVNQLYANIKQHLQVFA